MMMNGSAKYSDLGKTVVAPAVDNDDDDDAAGVLLVATPVPAATTATERVEVISPASLPGGYELHCDLLCRSAVVRVVRIAIVSIVRC